MRIRARLTYANVMSTIAVFIALGGTSYAAITITGRNVKNNSLTSADVKDNSLLKKDFKSGQVPAGAKGDPGPTGAQGPAGERGPQGIPGISQYARVKSNGTLIDGTAVAATRLQTGAYLLTFPTQIAKCAATANSTSFAGFDQSINRVWAQIGIGFGNGGGVSPNSLVVNLYDSGGPNVDSSFSVILVCP